ncbi:hypothetical protein [Deinococcus arenae]|nr:hypothetical protein [Deinococcus arenae]
MQVTAAPDALSPVDQPCEVQVDQGRAAFLKEGPLGLVGQG